jgi:hypothetical protein
MGSNPINLIGFDCHDNEGHFKIDEAEGYFAEDHVTNRTSLVRYFIEAAQFLRERKPETKIYNLNPHSAIKCFPFREPEEIMRG